MSSERSCLRFFCIGSASNDRGKTLSSMMTEREPTSDEIEAIARMGDMGIVRRASSGRHKYNFRRDKLILNSQSNTVIR